MLFIKKIQLVFIFFGSITILMSAFLEISSIGSFWYNLNSNSLVGFQGLYERISSSISFLKIDYLIYFLNLNLILLAGFFLIICSFFLGYLND